MRKIFATVPRNALSALRFLCLFCGQLRTGETPKTLAYVFGSVFARRKVVSEFWGLVVWVLNDGEISFISVWLLTVTGASRAETG